MKGLSLVGITKEYEGVPLLRGINLSVAPGEIACLLGPSGSGKSTLLRIIAGLEMPDSGQVFWDGADLARTPVHRRQFGFVFQDYALFPHMDVGKNVAFGLRKAGLKAGEASCRVAEALRAVNLPGFEQRAVQELSGGEQQRVALARTLVTRPRLLLLDEPLAALDRSLRVQLQEELRAALHSTGAPAVYVTHDQEEAFNLADRLYLLDEGIIHQGGDPRQLYQQPKDGKTAAFFGIKNQLAGVLANGVVKTPFGDFTGLDLSAMPIQKRKDGQRVLLLLRSARVCIAEERPAAGGRLYGRVVDCRFLPAGYLVAVACAEQVFTFILTRPQTAGSEVCLFIQAEDITMLAGEE
jgi:ABC-type Fe3+/spermidine/putrescine transport system ATPase subunit